MKLTAKLDRTIYGPQGGRRHLWVRLSVPRAGSPTARPPLDIALVLDRSGSMGGEKITLAREAAKGAVRLLRETDRCALVAYDDQVDVAAPASSVDASHRDRLSGALDRLDARGSTDLFGGWTRGAEQISDGASSERLRRVVLLTDGLANVGVVDHGEIVRHVRELNIRGVGTSTFGVGRDFDEDLVSGMAEAGGGHFYFIEQPRQIPDFLASELGELLTVVARNVHIAVTVTAGATVYNINDLPLLEGRWRLGDLSELAEIDLLFTIELPAGASTNVDIALNIEWTDAATQTLRSAADALCLLPGTTEEADAAPVDPETIAHVVKTRGAKVRQDALKYNRAGDYDSAHRLLAAELADLEPLTAAAPQARRELDQLRESVAPMSAPMDAMDAKRRHHAAYSARHSRPQN